MRADLLVSVGDCFVALSIFLRLPRWVTRHLFFWWRTSGSTSYSLIDWVSSSSFFGGIGASAVSAEVCLLIACYCCL
jgi:hypothetical protein